MSKDEIIKEMKQKINCNEDSDCNECPYIMGAECLLDLYQKQKEKTKKLETELEIKKYCKVDELTNDLIYYKNLAKEYQGNCISKDKIREILEYYGYTPVDNSDTIIAFYSDIKKLLEENK